MSSIFWIWEIGCVSCLAAAFIAHFTARRMNKITRMTGTVLLCALIGLAIVVWVSPWSFRGPLIDAGVIAAGFTSVVALALGISSIYSSRRSRLIGWITVAPILLVAIIGIPGVLGVLMAERDLQPRAMPDIDSEHSYRWVVFGGCHGMCSGATVTLFYHPLNFPFIEKKIWESQYYVQDYDLDFLQVSKSLDGESVQIGRRKRDGAIEVTTVSLR